MVTLEYASDVVQIWRMGIVVRDQIRGWYIEMYVDVSGTVKVQLSGVGYVS